VKNLPISAQRFTRRPSGGPDLKFLVNSLGLHAVLFIRRPSGGLAGLTPNSFMLHVQDFSLRSK